MEKRNFNDWIKNFKHSISTYSYYVDFSKVYKNVDAIKVELNILNSLIGSKNIKSEFISLIKKYPETIKCIPVLLAVRANEIYAIDKDGEINYNFVETNCSVEQYTIFMEKQVYSTLFQIILLIIFMIMLQVLKQVWIQMAEKTVADI
jgi:type II restriction enzyme